jgi:6,7-dimethyl-8-ribityllumazine synthase
MMSAVLRGTLEGDGLRIGIIAAEFNREIVESLVDGALTTLTEHGVAPSDITVVWVPGALELPLAASTLAGTGTVDGIIGLGCVIEGETTHFEHVGRESIAGLTGVSLETGLPVATGVLTVATAAQARVRAGLEPDTGGVKGEEDRHRGREAARACLEMINLLRAMRESV